MEIHNAAGSSRLANLTPEEGIKESSAFKAMMRTKRRPSSVKEMYRLMTASVARGGLHEEDYVRLKIRRRKRGKRFEKSSAKPIIGDEYFQVKSIRPPSLSGLDRLPCYRLVDLEGVVCTCKQIQQQNICLTNLHNYNQLLTCSDISSRRAYSDQSRI